MDDMISGSGNLFMTVEFISIKSEFHNKLSGQTEKQIKVICFIHDDVYFKGVWLTICWKVCWTVLLYSSGFLFPIFHFWCVVLIQMEFLTGTFAVFDKASSTSYGGKSLTMLYNCCLQSVQHLCLCMSCPQIIFDLWNWSFTTCSQNIELTLLRDCTIYSDQTCRIILF